MFDEGLTVHLILMGPQGSGKGTQAALLAPRLQLHHLSTGELFRAAIESGSPLGKEVQDLYDRGELIPDDLTIRLVAERLNDIDSGRVRAGGMDAGLDAPVARGALFDGFPRTRPQADALDALLRERGEQVDGVIEITAPEAELIARLEARARVDDTPEAIRRRLATYYEQTAPLLDEYRRRGLVVSINGYQQVDQVFAEILDKLTELLGSDAVPGGVSA